MSTLRIEVENLIENSKFNNILNEANKILNIELKSINEISCYKIRTEDLSQDELNDFLVTHSEDVFYDPIVQKINFSDSQKTIEKYEQFINFFIEVSYKAGVTDNLSNTTKEGLKLLGVHAQVATSTLFLVKGNACRQSILNFAKEYLANQLIQSIEILEYSEFIKSDRFKKISFPEVVLNTLPDANEISLEISDTELEKLNLNRCLALTINEIKFIRDYYRRVDVKEKRIKDELPYGPTDVELEVIAQTWSEHCKHKIFSSLIDHHEKDTKDTSSNYQKINGLYKTYIKNLTRRIEKEKKLDWLISVFDDNAGIVRFDKNIDLCIKVETHNSPSALDPYGGAITGILGVNRDILGCGMGAKPIANTDVFCFAPPSWPDETEIDELPVGLKHPRRILRGVHQGIEDGGNKSGIPTVNGAIYFDQDFAGKPLVFCGTVGIMPQVLNNGQKSSLKNPNIGDRIFMVGGAVGADGIHGATMSSLELNENSPVTAVQIGDPLTQKRMLDFIVHARDAGVFSAITDNGAGGLSSSVGEMATFTNGALIDLKKCPLKYSGLMPYEIMISESQERMTLAVPKKCAEEFIRISEKYGVISTDIGEFTNTGNLTIMYGELLVGKLDLEFMHNALPQMELISKWDAPIERTYWTDKKDKSNIDILDDNIFSDILYKLLESPNISSKESWVRRYDHEVLAATHIKPFIGEKGHGPGDSGVIWLYPHGGEKDNGISIGCGLNPRMSLYNPYLMAQYSVDEAVRNIISSGGDPSYLCLLDNFCWPNPVQSLQNPNGDYKLGQLVKTCQGLFDICLKYSTPLVSGKDSMKNDFRGKKKNGEDVNISILPTLLITGMAKTSLSDTVTPGFKSDNDLIYLLGNKGSGMLGSEFLEFFNLENNDLKFVPKINLDNNIILYRSLHQAMKKNLISSCHDISDGGAITAITESLFENNFGAIINTNESDKIKLIDSLFNEAPGRFIVSINESNVKQFEEHFNKDSYLKIGVVHKEPKLIVKNNNDLIINELTENLLTRWKKEMDHA